jgi:hypothetical protein
MPDSGSITTLVAFGTDSRGASTCVLEYDFRAAVLNLSVHLVARFEVWYRINWQAIDCQLPVNGLPYAVRHVSLSLEVFVMLC